MITLLPKKKNSQSSKNDVSVTSTSNSFANLENECEDYVSSQPIASVLQLDPGDDEEDLENTYNVSELNVGASTPFTEVSHV